MNSNDFYQMILKNDYFQQDMEYFWRVDFRTRTTLSSAR